MLVKCLHGETQNPNEAFNQVIWKKCPKSMFVGRQLMEISVYLVVISYGGFAGLRKVCDLLEIPTGQFFSIRTAIEDICVKNLDKKATAVVKDTRKKLIAVRKVFRDKEREVEGGDVYCSGNFLA